MSRTSVITVVYNCLISSLYLSSFSCSFLSLSLAILYASSSCCIMSFIMISLRTSLLLPLLGVGLSSA
jgi:hypothetical protein